MAWSTCDPWHSARGDSIMEGLYINLAAHPMKQGGAAAPRAILVAARTVQTNRQQAHGRSSAAEAGAGSELRKPPAGGAGGAAGIRGSAPCPQSVPSESRRRY
ncbi:hypothetical protein TRIUR3_28131 [Triticum urartu]|uniref:Uncharacterized protein n=1 Tax=Triticum urartu TaxID=4572 RepID=M7ZY15_TRIUA|nr:hypothetical protein TRIUR3_28131 [Triticum urartu]